jgi:hypothetical protein
LIKFSQLFYGNSSRQRGEWNERYIRKYSSDFFLDQVRKEIHLHLQNGEKIDIPLWDAKMVDMGNGHLFVFGKVFDQSKRSYPSDENTSEKLLPWNL